jgi:hypothetical protein
MRVGPQRRRRWRCAPGSCCGAPRAPRTLLDEPRPGAPRKITDAQIERAIATTLESTPRDATPWSTRLRHPRFHLHFTPTSASWLNLVERWSVELTRKQIKRGSHRSTKALRDAITTYIDLCNDAPRPFVWSKTADEILDNVARFCTRISESRHQGLEGNNCPSWGVEAPVGQGARSAHTRGMQATSNAGRRDGSAAQLGQLFPSRP